MSAQNLKETVHPLAKQAQRFLEELRDEKRLMKSSLKIYEMELALLLQAIPQPNEEALRKILRGLAAATATRKLIIWRSFLRTCPAPWQDLAANIPNPKQREKQPRFLTEEEVFRLESACYRSKQSARDRLFLALGLELGLRVTESLSLKFKDFEEGWLRLIRKGGKEQLLPLTPSIQALVHFWREERKALLDDYVFEGRNLNQGMSVRNAQKILTSLAQDAGLDSKIHPHALRHTFATRMAANGISLVALKEFLGHRRMSTTERYLHVTSQHLKESLRFLKPS